MWVASLAALAAAAVVAAPSSVPGETESTWRQKPSSQQILSMFPARALQQGIDGRARIRCRVSAGGGLHDCEVVFEQPSGYGFGAAALALSPQFLMTPSMRDGHPVDDGVVTIPVNFQAGGRSMQPIFTETVINDPLWTSAPTRAEVAAAYPRGAATARLAGWTAMRCEVAGDGRLRDCRSGSETPKDQGFAGAARSLAGRFRVAPLPGKATPPSGALVTVTVAFSPDLLEPGAATKPPPVPRRPEWTDTPAPADAIATFPAAATAAHIEKGGATVRCTVQPDGRLGECRALDERPAGLGFGVAAVAMAPHLRMSLWTADGTPTAGALIDLPLNYDMSPPPPPAAKP